MHCDFPDAAASLWNFREDCQLSDLYAEFRGEIPLRNLVEKMKVRGREEFMAEDRVNYSIDDGIVSFSLLSFRDSKLYGNDIFYFS
jgi:hypothetical protein